MRETGFRLISDLALLPAEAEKLVEKIATENTKWGINQIKRNRFKAILNGNELISFISYSAENRTCVLDFIWGKPFNRKFYKEYKSAPAQHLIEHIIRQGFKIIQWHDLTEYGKKTLSSFSRYGKVVSESGETLGKKVFPDGRVVPITDTSGKLIVNSEGLILAYKKTLQEEVKPVPKPRKVRAMRNTPENKRFAFMRKKSRPPHPI